MSADIDSLAAHRRRLRVRRAYAAFRQRLLPLVIVMLVLVGALLGLAAVALTGLLAGGLGGVV
jgi:small-conductance mechanosensitive channel